MIATQKRQDKLLQSIGNAMVLMATVWAAGYNKPSIVLQPDLEPVIEGLETPTPPAMAPAMEDKEEDAITPPKRLRRSTRK